VRDVIDDIETRDILTIEQEDCVALLLTKNSDKYVGNTDFFAAARLHVKHGALQNTLKAESRLHFALIALWQTRRALVDVLA
jgi:hypothetical protein